MSYESLLNLTCTIQSRTISQNAIGGTGETWANKATNVKCTIQPFKGGLMSEEQAQELNITHHGFFLFPATPIAGEKVIDNSSNEYRVIRVFDAAGRIRHKEVLLELLEKA